MRIGVDGRSLSQPGARGVARYARTLLTALAENFPSDEWKLLVAGDLVGPPIAGTEVIRPRLRGRALYGLAGALGRPRLDRLLGGVDAFWAPAPAPLALSPGVPLVLSLHDLAWELRPSDFTPYERIWHWIARPRSLAARAARIVADSESTRGDAIERWALDPQRIVTIRGGVQIPAEPAEASARVAALPRRYMLTVGALEPRKAPDVLGRAFHDARSRGLDAELVIAGEGRSEAQISGPGVHLLGRVSDAELDRLYAGALALVMPSRLEGFGLPPLEAALRGTPSIVSDLPVFDETLGPEAVRVPVDDAAALARAMLELEADDDRRFRLAAAARERAQQLTPAGSAAALHEVLEEVAGR